MERGFYLGIDTSNYTTSAAAVTPAGEVFLAKRLLSVPLGQRGMRQSEALFCHTRDLGEIVEECLSSLRREKGDLPLLGVGVSQTPRPVEGSYMPCFLAGVNAARVTASAAGVPLFCFSHQEGHIEAARFGAAQEGNPLEAEEFFAFHLSGGTTELVHVTQESYRYRCELVAATKDLTCGQLIDRCGVKLGLPFPAGPHLEALAKSRKGTSKPLVLPLKENGINLSGMENRFDALQKEGRSPEECAAFVFAAVEGAIRALMGAVPEDAPLLFSGGVASSLLLRQRLASPRFHFSPPQYCGDNAVGIALLAKKGVLYGP